MSSKNRTVKPFKFQFAALLLKDCHREPVTDVTGVAIPIKFAECYLKCPKIHGIPTPVCALARNDSLLITAR